MQEFVSGFMKCCGLTKWWIGNIDKFSMPSPVGSIEMDDHLTICGITILICSPHKTMSHSGQLRRLLLANQDSEIEYHP